MAKDIELMSDGGGPPDPSDVDGFTKWLRQKPRQWSGAIASRAALRMLPLLSSYHHSASVILPVLRAAAVAQFAARYPNSETYPSDKTTQAATRAASSTRASSAGTSVAVVLVVLDAAARAADAAHVIRYEAAHAAASAADAAIAVVAAAAADAETTDAAANSAVRAAVRAMSEEVRSDARRLLEGIVPTQQILAAPLWTGLPPARIGGGLAGFNARFAPRRRPLVGLD